jgi:hypothetical protein
MIEEPIYEDGDIIAFGNLGFPPIMAIFKGYWRNDINHPGLIYHVCLRMGTVDYYNGVLCNSDNLRLATEEEKQKLFDALKKDGKQWNTERKCIEELPRNTHEFKPFDKVDEKLLRTKEVADKFGVALRTVNRWDEAGLIHSISIGGKLKFYKESEIKNLLNGNSNEPK